MKRLYFLWDYDLTEEQVKELLKTGDAYTRRWLIGRILQYAKFNDIWKYVSLKEVYDMFPQLQLRPEMQKRWAYTLSLWKNNENTN